MTLTRAAAQAVVSKKAGGAENSSQEIADIVRAYSADELDEQLMVDWLRAIMRVGMSFEETASLTDVMAHSGHVLDWRGVSPLADKHSTGGVGDDVSLVAVPLAAACGVHVAKLSGGALGHTGGTLDKLACIPGLRTALSMSEFKAQVASSVGCAIVQASDELAPADKKLYRLRHHTNTIASVPLITASVLSKKIAGGAPNLVIDVKAGSCAFMQSVEEARALAASLLAVGTRLGKNMEVLVTDMDAPLADSIGDGLELREALDTLRTNRQSRLRELALTVAADMIAIATNERTETGRSMAERALESCTAYDRFASMAQAQGGDVARFDENFAFSGDIPAAQAGFVLRIDGRALGALVAEHKSHQQRGSQAHGRAGLKLLKRRGDGVRVGEPLMRAAGMDVSDALLRRLRATVSIGPARVPEPPPVIESRRGEAQRI